MGHTPLPRDCSRCYTGERLGAVSWVKLETRHAAQAHVSWARLEWFMTTYVPPIMCSNIKASGCGPWSEKAQFLLKKLKTLDFGEKCHSGSRTSRSLLTTSLHMSEMLGWHTLLRYKLSETIQKVHDVYTPEGIWHRQSGISWVIQNYYSFINIDTNCIDAR